jgi:hypothetical protein
MTGWVQVGPAGLAEEADLARWVAWGVTFSLALPAK